MKNGGVLLPPSKLPPILNDNKSTFSQIIDIVFVSDFFSENTKEIFS